LSLNTILATAPLATTGFHLKATGTALGNSLIWDNGTNVGIGNTNTSYTLDVSGSLRATTSAYFATTSGGVGMGTTNTTYATLNVKASSTQLYNGIAIFSTNGTESFFGIGNSGSVVGFDATYGASGAYLPIAFNVGGSERLRITTAGNVGIGTSTPSAALQVSAVPSTNGDSVYQIVAFDTNTATSRVGAGITFGGYYNGTTDTSTAFSSIKGFKENLTNNDYAGALAFMTRINGGSSTERMRITSGGDVNMNATSGNKLVTVKGQTGNGYYGEVRMGNVDHSAGIIGKHVSSGNANLEFWTEYYSSGGYQKRMTIDYAGNIGAPSGTNIYTASDIRLKQNITTITNGLDKVLGLNPVMFNWVNGFVESEDGKDMLGFIAQEVQDIIPEAVEGFNSGNTINLDDVQIDNPLRVNEKFIIPILVKAIQEQQIQIQNLQEQINILAK
jgi:hypothetical protein